MIISEKWKYIFVGIPFSASSAISRELVHQYDGQPLYWKHANITECFAHGKNTSDYFVFAVRRNPVDMLFTLYNKIVTNAHGVYTTEKYFLENGGWVSSQARRVYHEIKRDKVSFDEYVERYYQWPYDSAYSLNHPYLDFSIDFDNLDTSFQQALAKTGIRATRSLPVHNATRKPAVMNLRDSTFQKTFGPFLYYNGFPGSAKPGIRDRLIYKALKPIRFHRIRKLDRRMRQRTVNDYDFLEKD